MRKVSPSGLKLSPALILVALAAIAVIVFLSTSFFVVDQTERAVVTTFGRFTKVAEPGLHYKIPFGIQKSYAVKTEVVQTEQFGFR
ncbi:MAG TPA: SPFH domain-containing protein, partial [Spirochaetia bacterium]|nr:SPFH domain-containing protein [Spirochaetia bacterium]